MAKFTNRDRLKRKMLAIPQDVKRAMRVQNAKNAGDLTEAMKGFAAQTRDSGTLVASIRHEDASDNTRISQIVEAGGAATTRAVRSGASATYDYALAQEYGTEKQDANPFFWPAWRLYRRRLKARMTRATKKAIQGAIK